MFLSPKVMELYFILSANRRRLAIKLKSDNDSGNPDENPKNDQRVSDVYNILKLQTKQLFLTKDSKKFMRTNVPKLILLNKI